MQGYDIVSYFRNHDSYKGDESYIAIYNDQEWLFHTQKNRDLFLDNPELYQPQFDGYCANHAADGRFVSSEPDIWYIDQDNRLFFFHSREDLNLWLHSRAFKISEASRFFKDRILRKNSAQSALGKRFYGDKKEYAPAFNE